MGGVRRTHFTLKNVKKTAIMSFFVSSKLQRLNIYCNAILTVLLVVLVITPMYGSVSTVAQNPFALLSRISTKLLPLSGSSHTLPDVDCYLARGNWCELWKRQKRVRWKDPFGDHRRGYTQGKPMRTCLWNCNHVGVCDYSTGLCRCPAGWSGPACDIRRERPCSQRFRNRGSMTPYDEPFNISLGYGTTGACAGYCDKDTGTCYCPSHTKYGRVPAAVGSLPGTPPINTGRQLSLHCQPRNDSDGTTAPASDSRPTYEQLFGPNGWCEADVPDFKCPCIVDGLIGQHCESVRESFCINQCSGHGACNGGFCKCYEGWYGHDCAHKVPGVDSTDDDATVWKPWIRDYVRTPASEPPTEPTRPRPLIYVYDMDPVFDQIILQYRIDAGTCVHRAFGAENGSAPFVQGYCSETGLHELFLQSTHRTLDPEEADFFYVPMYTSCLQYPVANFNDYPFYHTTSASYRVHMAASMMVEAHHWIRRTYPYWDRYGGKDHILVRQSSNYFKHEETIKMCCIMMQLAPHDEGSCWVPDVFRNATILTHWGYTGYNNESFTSYGADMFDAVMDDPIYQPGGMRKIIRQHRCVDPNKDLVIPAMFPKLKFSESPFLSDKKAVNREFLAVHKGRVMDFLPKYSRGSRQNLTKLCREKHWWEKYRIYIGEANPSNSTLSYSELLTRSIFCPVLMGEGFTTRFEDAVMHGCIPVVIMDDVLGDFETILRIEEFSLRVSFADMSKLPEILQAVPKKDIDRMQNNIQRIWNRYVYNFHNKFADYGPNVTDDAFSTIIQWLHAKLG